MAAFHDIQESLSKKPVLYSPNFDEHFILQTDASDRGLGTTRQWSSSCLHQPETVPQGGQVFNGGKGDTGFQVGPRLFPVFPPGLRIHPGA